MEYVNYQPIYLQIIWTRLGRELQSLTDDLELSLVPVTEPLQYLEDLKAKLHPEASELQLCLQSHHSRV